MTRQRVFVIGGTGTIGQATVRALLRRGHEVVCLVRPGSAAQDRSARLAAAFAAGRVLCDAGIDGQDVILLEAEGGGQPSIGRGLWRIRTGNARPS